MPNWCENRVCFKHSDTTKLAELDVALRGKALQYLHPMPSELKELLLLLILQISMIGAQLGH